VRPTYVTQGALGASAWIPVNRLQNGFGIGLGCTISSGASLTYSVQHTFDDPSPKQCVITRSTTTATVTSTAHGLSVGDNILVTGAGDANLNGSYAVASIVDANTYTYTVANTGLTTANAGVTVQEYRVFNHATLVGQTTRQDGNYAFPPAMVRITNTVYASGNVTLAVLQGQGQ
jgi:hypothetical protein